MYNMDSFYGAYDFTGCLLHVCVYMCLHLMITDGYWDESNK